MKMSTKGRYGLRAMLDLALNSGGDHVALNTIAERQDISTNYLEQVFSTLRKAGLVVSIKGAQGGYMLADSLNRITVGQILRALEGDLAVVGDKTGSEALNPVEYCLKTQVWDRINTSIDTVVDSITLEDLLIEYRKMQGAESLMFYI
ncbi:MAG TPA: Rrf2 family transcriptional regulator [Syntrophomonas sp.]|jgi:Rrf2 family protein|nr:Rrf2 family transcriptional regulator [Syntrophomonas sp.]